MKTSTNRRTRPSQRTTKSRTSRPRTNPRTGRTSKSRKRNRTSPRLHVKFAEADRIRSVLLSEDNEFLCSGDVRSLITILNDVYPPRPKQAAKWQPFLIGVGIGLVLLAGMMVVA